MPDVIWWARLSRGLVSKRHRTVHIVADVQLSLHPSTLMRVLALDAHTHTVLPDKQRAAAMNIAPRISDVYYEKPIILQSAILSETGSLGQAKHQREARLVGVVRIDFHGHALASMAL